MGGHSTNTVNRETNNHYVNTNDVQNYRNVSNVNYNLHSSTNNYQKGSRYDGGLDRVSNSVVGPNGIQVADLGAIIIL